MKKRLGLYIFFSSIYTFICLQFKIFAWNVRIKTCLEYAFAQINSCDIQEFVDLEQYIYCVKLICYDSVIILGRPSLRSCPIPPQIPQPICS